MWLLSEGVDGNGIEYWKRLGTGKMEFVCSLSTDSGALAELKSIVDQMNRVKLQPPKGD